VAQRHGEIDVGCVSACDGKALSPLFVAVTGYHARIPLRERRTPVELAPAFGRLARRARLGAEASCGAHMCAVDAFCCCCYCPRSCMLPTLMQSHQVCFYILADAIPAHCAADGIAGQPGDRPGGAVLEPPNSTEEGITHCKGSKRATSSMSASSINSRCKRHNTHPATARSSDQFLGKH
jgi:hypothetical protein